MFIANFKTNLVLMIAQVVAMPIIIIFTKEDE